MPLNENILSFLFNLEFNVELPDGFEVMHPFKDAETQRVTTEFYKHFHLHHFFVFPGNAFYYRAKAVTPSAIRIVAVN